MNIRLARVTDYEMLKKIKPSISDRIIEERLSRQEEGKVEFMVLEDNNESVSFVLLKWEGKKTHPEYPDMEDLYTKEESRRKGYATLLIKECEKRVKEKGFKKIGMAVNPDKNSKAKVFYERLGYKHYGSKPYVDAVYNGAEDWVIDLEKEM